MSSLEQEVRLAAQYGIHFLLARQGRDGFWREYHLPPGPSEYWATAWIGWCLYECRYTSPPSRVALANAVSAVWSGVRDGGWGYNRSTGPDADSTAWVCRFLTAHGMPSGSFAMQVLGPFLDLCGGAHTFREPGAGSWGEAHADVTPMVGLALAEAGGVTAESILVMRRRVIRDQRPDGNWTSFWWASDVYATAWSLVFLAYTGGIPAVTAGRARQALLSFGALVDLTALELSLLLIAWTRLDPTAISMLDIFERLLDSQRPDGGWLPSPLLLVPERFPEAQDSTMVAHADGSGLLTTGLACVALASALAGYLPDSAGQTCGSLFERRFR